MIRFVEAKTGQELDRYLNGSFERLRRLLEEADAAPDMQKTVQEHFRRRYPGSRHWDPKKVVRQGKNKIRVSVPGVTRAYRDVVIRPIGHKYLAIPLHAAAFAKDVKEVKGLFKFGNTLAMREFGTIVPWYALAEEVHQKQDPTLMPTDEELGKAVVTSLMKTARRLARRKWL